MRFVVSPGLGLDMGMVFVCFTSLVARLDGFTLLRGIAAVKLIHLKSSRSHVWTGTQVVEVDITSRLNGGHSAENSGNDYNEKTSDKAHLLLISSC